MKLILITIVFLLPLVVIGQGYKDSLDAYLVNYVDKHEAVPKEDKKHFSFFEVDPEYRVVARIEKINDAPWVPFATSGKMKKNYRVYGILHFTIHDTSLKLNLYQSQDLIFSKEYKDYLFLPFTDATSGKESYDAGRYIDLQFADIVNNTVIIDFNKSYNPYCAYVSGVFNCPIPPKENHLDMAIKAGERKFKKH